MQRIWAKALQRVHISHSKSCTKWTWYVSAIHKYIYIRISTWNCEPYERLPLRHCWVVHCRTAKRTKSWQLPNWPHCQFQSNRNPDLPYNSLWHTAQQFISFFIFAVQTKRIYLKCCLLQHIWQVIEHYIIIMLIANEY